MRLPPVSVGALRAHAHGEASTLVRERVERARASARAPANAIASYARRSTRFSRRVTSSASCRLGASAERLLASAVERLGLSARAYGKVLRVARTIADLAEKEDIAAEHVAEAIALRVLDRKTSDELAA